MTLMTMALKTALVLVLTALLARAARNSSAALRHLIWMTGLVAALLLPLASSLLPRWQVLPIAAAVEPVVTLATGNTSPQSTIRAKEFLPSLTMIWLGGVVTMLGAMLTGRLALRRWTRRARPVSSPEWQAAIEEVMRTDRRASRIHFLEADWIATPCTWGVIRPTVLLPSEAVAWTPALRRYALTHELAHIRRLDPLAHTVSRLVCAIHWYNPLAWMAVRSARLEREQACDDAVLGASSTAEDYAGFLVQVARSGALLRYPEPALGLAQHSTLATRIRALLDPSRRRGPVRRPMLASVVTVGLALLVSLAALAPAQQQSQEPVRQVTVRPDSSLMQTVIKKICSRRSASDSARGGDSVRATVVLRDVSVTSGDSVRKYTVRIRGC
jgi:beta-lactamase regulating signal transducer with metallopeptidase domain